MAERAALRPSWSLPVLWAIGAALAVWMTSRSQIEGDQLHLFLRGWLLVREGHWVHFGNPTSAGGYELGGLTALAIGAPLYFWMDHRAPVLPILGAHVLAYALLDRVIARILGARARFLLAVFYWLAPWQLFFAAFTWNPNYLYLTGALHLWACFRQRDRGRFWPSLLMVASVGLSPQLHPEAVVLALAGALLWWRGYWRPHWGGVAAGVVITFAALVPWAIEAWQHPELLPGSHGFFGRGLLYVFPLGKGLLQLLRYASLSCTAKLMTHVDFTPALGATADGILTPVFFVLTDIVGPLTVLIPSLAALWMLRRAHRRRRVRCEQRTARVWLQGYALWVFAAAALVYAIAPTTPMMWQGLVIQHAAILPVIMWTDVLLRSAYARRARTGLRTYFALSLVMLIGMSIASPMYRRGGRHASACVLAADHPMLQDLRLAERCSVTVDPEHGHGDLHEMIPGWPAWNREGNR